MKKHKLFFCFVLAGFVTVFFSCRRGPNALEQFVSEHHLEADTLFQNLKKSASLNRSKPPLQEKISLVKVTGERTVWLSDQAQVDAYFFPYDPAKRGTLEGMNPLIDTGDAIIESTAEIFTHSTRLGTPIREIDDPFILQQLTENTSQLLNMALFVFIEPGSYSAPQSDSVNRSYIFGSYQTEVRVFDAHSADYLFGFPVSVKNSDTVAFNVLQNAQENLVDALIQDLRDNFNRTLKDELKKRL